MADAGEPDRLRGAHVAVVGGGPGGLMAAERLARQGAEVAVYERMPSVGRKLLVAGRGGLNLTHTEATPAFRDRYRGARDFLAPALDAFGPDDLRSWCAGLGQETFVGTSGRVFPVALRATPLLRAWILRLRELGVELRVRHEWQGWEDGAAEARPDQAPPDQAGLSGRAARSGTSVRFVDAAGLHVVDHADAVVLALGGGSWPRTGSDGAWVGAVRASGVTVNELRPANCGFVVAWSEQFRARFAGAPVKNVAVAFGDERSRGDVTITSTGIEGGPVYAVSAAMRDALGDGAATPLHLDLFPDLPVDALAGRLSDRLAGRRPKDSWASTLRRAGFSPVATGLVHEALGQPLPKDPQRIATVAKAIPVVCVAPQALARAISSAGGVALDGVDASMMLRARPGTFVAGEMLDWEAPTGGYLLQATFSTAVRAAEGAARWLHRAG